MSEADGVHVPLPSSSRLTACKSRTSRQQSYGGSAPKTLGICRLGPIAWYRGDVAWSRPAGISSRTSLSRPLLSTGVSDSLRLLLRRIGLCWQAPQAPLLAETVRQPGERTVAWMELPSTRTAITRTRSSLVRLSILAIMLELSSMVDKKIDFFLDKLSYLPYPGEEGRTPS